MQNHVLGLDISDRSVEIVSVTRKKGGLRVVATGRADIPPGVVALGVIQDAETLAMVLAKLLDETFGPKRGRITAGISLPEMLVYSKTFIFPNTLTTDLVRKAVLLEAAELFPIPLVRSVTSMATVSRGKETQEVFFAAADRETVNAYIQVLRRVGVSALFVEAESMSVGRALLDPRIQDPVLVADMGSRSTNIAIHDRGGLRMSGNVMAAGDTLSAAIEHKLGVTLAEADQLRKKVGFDPSIDDGRLFLVMELPMHEIMEEMRRTMDYYEGRTGRKVVAIILAGGTSLTPQLADYVASNFAGVEVLAGNPLRDVSLEGLREAAEVTGAPVLWSASLGLAYRAVGARGSPSINLLPGAHEETGFKAFINNIIAMVTKPRKTGAKKPRAAKPAPEAEAPIVASAPVVQAVPDKPVEPVKLQIDAAPAVKPVSLPPETKVVEAVAPAPAPAPAPVQETAVATSTLDIIASKPAPIAAAPVEEKDYGSGIGDILKNDAEIQVDPKQAADAAFTGATIAENRRSIASILETRSAPQPIRAADTSYRTVYSGEETGGGRTKLMLAAVILMFSMAAGGIYMFVSKNGAPKLPGFVTGFFDKKDSVVAPVAEETATVPETVNVTVLLATKAVEDESRPVILTRSVETDVKGEGTFPATGEVVAAGVSGKAQGQATIINESSQPYTFVATTRLLSKEGVLFRMVSASPIPANGSVSVEIAADQPGPSGDIGPTTFTIPGLPGATQKVVYAKSDAAMTGGSGKAKGVTESDLSVAKASIADKLRTEAYENLKALLADGESINEDLITSTEVALEAPAVGSAATEFKVKMTLRYRALVLPEKEFAPLLDAALDSAIPSGTNSADYSLGLPLYAVEAYDAATDKAEVRAEAPIIKQ